MSRAIRAILVAFALVLAVPAGASAYHTAVASDYFGIGGGGMGGSGSSAYATDFQQLASGGVKVVRLDASWGGIQPTSTTWDWSGYDAFITQLALKGLRWYPMLAYSAPWASSNPTDQNAAYYPPADDSQYAAFSKAVVDRYGSGGAFWTGPGSSLTPQPVTAVEIWNEPNMTQFYRGSLATPARYMGMYQAARTAIRTTHPEVRVVGGSLWDNGGTGAKTWMQAMFAAAPTAPMDAISWHPYVSGPWLVVQRIHQLRLDLLNISGRGNTPIEITEFGLARSGTYDTTIGQWEYDDSEGATRGEFYSFVAHHLPMEQYGVERLIPYTWANSVTWQMTDLDGSVGDAAQGYFDGIYKQTHDAAWGELIGDYDSIQTSGLVLPTLQVSCAGAGGTGFLFGPLRMEKLSGQRKWRDSDGTVLATYNTSTRTFTAATAAEVYCEAWDSDT